MKHRLLCLLLCLVGTLFSCSKDDDSDVENQENIVTFKVYTNTPGVPITLTDCCEGSYLIIKDNWERTVKTKNYAAQIVADCDDKNTLITGEIYINGKLKKRSEANRFLKFAVVIKGHPIIGGAE